MKEQVISVIKAIFKGFGQIMLQDNALTGFLFIAAIFFDSPQIAMGGLLGNVIAIITASLIKSDDKDIKSGLYGFNASLIGFAMTFYFQPNFWVWGTIVIASVLSAVLMKYALRYKLPAYTFPFVLLTWIALFVLSIPELALHTIPEHFVDIDDIEDFLIEGHAFGQVIFQGSFLVGVIFFLGVFISKPISALYGFIAVIVSVYISRHGNVPYELLKDGTYSFNAVLCGIAMSGLRVRDGLYVLLSVIIATYVDLFMIDLGWTTLTFPFVVAMWIMFPVKKLDDFIFDKIEKRMK